MKEDRALTPLRVLLPVGIGTCLSLLGDSSLYAVLPTHTVDAGVTIASVGILLSANRFIRLILNGPAGVAYDRGRRRRLFVAALFVGACSTALYGLVHGFWPLLVGRLLWGLAWSGIWVGGNTIVLDVARDDTRGRWVGLYHVSFFLGSAGGALLGGFLTDRMGYHSAMNVSAVLTCAGAIVALVFLPETGRLSYAESEGQAISRPAVSADTAANGPSSPPHAPGKAELTSAVALYAANRLALAGVLRSTFGLFLLQQMGDTVQVGGQWIGVATVTGLALGFSTLVSATSAPLMGWLSDRVGDRWRFAAAGLIPGVAGFALLAVGWPLITFFGITLVSITGGSNQGLSTALIGDLGNVGRTSRQLGVLFTVGDLASAVGPPLAYALIPQVGIKTIYLMLVGLFAVMFVVTLKIGKKRPA